MAFVTDSVRGAGSPPGIYSGLYPGAEVEVTADRGVRRVGDDALSGSALTTAQAFRNAVQRFGRSIGEASALCSATPAAVLGETAQGPPGRGAWTGTWSSWMPISTCERRWLVARFSTAPADGGIRWLTVISTLRSTRRSIISRSGGVPRGAHRVLARHRRRLPRAARPQARRGRTPAVARHWAEYFAARARRRRRGEPARRGTVLIDVA